MQDNDLPQIGTPMQTDGMRAREVLKGVVLLHGALDADAAIDAMLAFAAPPAVEREEKGACPFCGTPDPLSTKSDDKIHPYQVRCETCGCGTAHHGDFQAAWAAWTRRPTKPSPTLHPSDREEGKGDASGFDLVGAIVRHMSDDLGFVVGQMPNEDQQRFYRLRDKAREWLIAEGARLDAILALSGSLAPEGGSPSCAAGHANYIGKCPYCHEKLPGIALKFNKQGDA